MPRPPPFSSGIQGDPRPKHRNLHIFLPLGVAMITTDASVRERERIGLAGDLHIRYLVALGRGERTRAWVVGCFGNPGHPLGPLGGGSYRNELFALAWQSVLLDVRAILGRARAFPHERCRRMLRHSHHQARQGISELACHETPNNQAHRRLWSAAEWPSSAAPC